MTPSDSVGIEPDTPNLPIDYPKAFITFNHWRIKVNVNNAISFAGSFNVHLFRNDMLG